MFLKNLTTNQKIQVCGKWILAGEHSVLRGGEAIVFPLRSRYLNLNYTYEDSELIISFKDSSHLKLDQIIWSVIDRVLEKLSLQRQDLKGRLEFESHILFGAGMGASATLCVALTRLFSTWGYIKDSDQYSFATDLENLFHGESSGVDVAVTLNNQALLFSREKSFQVLHIQARPKLYLSHTGAIGVTKDCVEQVKNLFLENPVLAQSIDQKMKQSVEIFKILLGQKDENSQTNQNWIQALNKSHECFVQWGLVNDAVKSHQKILMKAGAQAVKLTGSGGGGFMLSYWTEPPQNVTFDLIPCFN